MFNESKTWELDLAAEARRAQRAILKTSSIEEDWT